MAPQRSEAPFKSVVREAWKLEQASGTKPKKDGSKRAIQTVAASAHRRLENVHASPLELSMASTLKYVPPSYPKSDTEQMFLYEALRRGFMFKDLDQQAVFPTAYALIDAMEKIEVARGDVITKQGEHGDFYYVVSEGRCSTTVDGEVLQETMGKGASFGELALLFHSPRVATVTAMEDSVLFRVNQKTFRLICQTQIQVAELQKRNRLESIPFLAELSEADKLKLTDAMSLRIFKEGEILQTKGQEANRFWIIEDGDVKVCNIEVSGSSMADMHLESGDFFGQDALLAGIPTVADVVALSDGRAFVIGKDRVSEAVGDMEGARMRGLSAKQLESVRVIKNTMLNAATLDRLVKVMKPMDFEKGCCIMRAGERVEAALYFLRKGSVHMKSATQDKRMENIGMFGSEMLTLDATRGSNGPNDPTTTKAPCTVVAETAVACVVLRLADCRRVFDTVQMGRGGALFDSVVQMKVSLDDFNRHTILGAGTYGQVWLVSRTTSDGTMERVYALKLQSKADLIDRGQAEAVVREKKIMAEMNHPFIAKLVSSFQDSRFVYMLMDLIQGGELESIIHSDDGNTLLPSEAVFYAAGILEALTYMHRLGFVYRDLKPQNVLINSKGYPMITDFGFSKLVRTKTFTFCGTPFYVAPEVILNHGHSWAVDHWSLGVLIFEMLTGTYPFGEDFEDQIDLFAAIVQNEVDFPSGVSADSRSLVSGLLVKDPQKRLGSLAFGECDIQEHKWFCDMDFSKLRQQEIAAPFVPEIDSWMDASNFSDWSFVDDKLSLDYPELDPSENRVFENF